MSPHPLPPIYPHPSPLTTLLPHLTPHLPHTLPLIRRLQFRPPSPSPSAHVLATFPPHSQPPPSFSACWVDLTRNPETSCYVFSTYELPTASIQQSPSSTETEDIAEPKPEPHTNGDTHSIETKEQDASQTRAHLLALLQHITTLPSPATPYTNTLVIGSLTTSLLPLLAGIHTLPNAEAMITRLWANDPTTAIAIKTSVLSWVEVAYGKYVIPPSTTITKPTTTGTPTSNHNSNGTTGTPNTTDIGTEPVPSLPTGYSLSTLRRDELPAVVASTHIPRSESTLSQLPSICVRNPAGEAVSWGFWGFDGSLSSLHTVEHERRKGFSVVVARALMERLGAGRGGVEVGWFEGMEEGWVHGDVAVDNGASQGLMRKLGGSMREGWEVRWVGVDLGRVVGVVEGEYGESP